MSDPTGPVRAINYKSYAGCPADSGGLLLLN
jgi:hypothetical protein